MRSFLVCLLAMSLLCLTAVVASAQDVPPPIQTSGAAKYMSGGFGLGQRQAMTAIANQFNLKMEFAMTSGAYIADVQVTITDSQGAAVLTDISKGPWFMASLPAGAYTVNVSFNGGSKSQAVSLDNTLKTIVFRWD